MIILKAALLLLVNFILYASFGSFFEIRRGSKWSLAVTVGVGFFAYYAVFAFACLPVMLTYRPLSLLTGIWTAPCIIVPVISAAVFRKEWVAKFRLIRQDISENRGYYAFVALITAATVFLVIMSYNFTLDAAYYVAGVTTNVDTNMINVYDPFTGGWLDHFELRYVFATYYANDAVVCQLSHLPALVETKSVMSAVVMIIVNMIYAHITRFFFEDRTRALLMYILMVLTNYLFISIYTASNFLMTRTYEGKSVVGNIAVILIFVLYMSMTQDGATTHNIVKLFIVCLGCATASSTANMVIPAEVAVIFIPYAVIKKQLKLIPKVLICIIPEIVMMLVYVLYVKGWFAVYTFPR